MENNQLSFWQFSDQLRIQNSNLPNLSLNDSIWSNSHASKRPDQRRNFDIRVGGEVKDLKPKPSDFNSFNNEGWKIGAQKNIGINGGFSKGVYSKPLNNNNFNLKSKGEDDHGSKSGKKKNNNSDNNSNETADKRFKTLPPSEALPRNQTVGGYIFVCNNDTMQENLRRQLFGLPPRYRDSVRAITPGLPLFLYNYSTHQLHGIFEAASFGGTNIDPSAWEDKKCLGESRFPAQVRVLTRKICEPLEEDSFRPILHHYDGPKFRLELNVPEALSLLDIFGEQDP
ncbi:Asparagine-rich protein 1, asparagine-rich protein [Hibiscus trionum]|uniref:Asparagine-rich protein 1, asparagine-rich protein n=1 Tax=Hibiscus trionum TaxID=183268 RepID=A0A9W7IFW5_HIBTR|nr:Asparagine-rich protein 1, asparagine-rich protein [Hibiscus trionum]